MVDKVNNSQVRVELLLPNGKTVYGYVSETEVPYDQAVKQRDYLEENISDLSRLTVYLSTIEQPDAKITFPGQLIRNSVVTLRIIKW